MDLTDKLNVIDAIAKSGRKGCTALALSHEVSLISSDIRSFLTNNPNFFCKIGDSNKFRLNPFGSLKGDSEKIKAELKQQEQRLQEMSKFSVVDDLLL